MNQRSFHRGIARTTIATSFGFALVQLDVTIVNVALPHMANDLRTGVAGLQWVVDAYALAFAALLLSMGNLGDRLGARRVYLGGMAMFALASVLCGCATDTVTLIVGRALQGLGAAAMMPCSLALLSHATAHEHGLRARAVGWWTAAGSITIAAGPIVGGLLMSITNWRSIFFVNVPVCLFGAWLTLRVPETEHKARHRHVDLPGQLLAILALTGLTMAVIEAHPLGWTHPLVLSCVVTVVVSVPLFLLVESRSPAPMLPLRFFSAPGFSMAVTYGVIMNFTYYGIVFLLSLYLQRVLGYSALHTGLAYLPLTATFFGVNIFSGWLVGKVGARLPMVLGDRCRGLRFVPAARRKQSVLADAAGIRLVAAGHGAWRAGDDDDRALGGGKGSFRYGVGCTQCRTTSRRCNGRGPVRRAGRRSQRSDRARPASFVADRAGIVGRRGDVGVPQHGLRGGVQTLRRGRRGLLSPWQASLQVRGYRCRCLVVGDKTNIAIRSNQQQGIG